MYRVNPKEIGARTFMLFTPVILISTVVLVLFLTVYKKLDLRNIYESQQNILTLQKQKASSSFQSVLSDILFLKNNSIVIQYLNDPYKNGYFLGDFLLGFAESKEIYDQIRLLDANGQEELRINYNKGKPAIVPDEMLQDKSSRYYFQSSKNLSGDTIYISPLDLNIENGAVEIPYKPAIRFAVSLKDYDGNFRGVLVLNYLASEILTSIREHSKISYGTLSLLDTYSNWLIAEKPEDEFAFMFGDSKNSFSSLYPEAWQKIYLTEHGSVTHPEDGIFFYDTLRPMPTLADEDSDIIDINFSTGLKLYPPGYEWKVVTHLPADFFVQRYRSLFMFSYSVYAMVNLSLLIASFMIAYIRLKQKAIEKEHMRLQQEHMKQMKQQIEQTQELVHILCHDLVNPISCVLGIMEIMDEDREYSEELSGIIHSALRSAVDIVDLVKTMRALEEGKKKLELEPVNLKNAVESSLMLTRSKFENKEITAYAEIPEDAVVLSEKVSLVNSVINNIITNALKFSPRGSVIEFSVKQDSTHTVLLIKDQGKGIPADMIDDIFDSTKPTSRPGTEGESGTGFGMPLVKKFMQRYKGEIKVDSKEQKEGVKNHGTVIALIFRKP